MLFLVRWPQAIQVIAPVYSIHIVLPRKALSGSSTSPIGRRYDTGLSAVAIIFRTWPCICSILFVHELVASCMSRRGCLVNFHIYMVRGVPRGHDSRVEHRRAQP